MEKNKPLVNATDFLRKLLSQLKLDSKVEDLDENQEELEYYAGLIEARDKQVVQFTLQKVTEKGRTLYIDFEEAVIDKDSILHLKEKIVEDLKLIK